MLVAAKEARISMSRTIPQAGSHKLRTSNPHTAAVNDPLPTHALRFQGDATAPGLRREWLLTNGGGSFAMGTAAGINTRRYHGLLVGASHPPVGRIVALHQVIEKLTVTRKGKTESAELSAMMFSTDNLPGDEPMVNGDGPKLLRRFTKGLTVCWTYQWNGVEIDRELTLHWKQPTAQVQYRLRGLDVDAASLELSPMMTLRDFHGICRKAETDGFTCDIGIDDVTVKRGDHAVNVHVPGSRFERGRDWWYKLYYERDAERGQESEEDYFVPGRFAVDLSSGDDATVDLTVTLGSSPATPAESPAEVRLNHLQPMLDFVGDADVTAKALVIAADDFVVDRTIQDRKLSTILAGYPWFADWGRDTFIALPGLLLTTGRYEEARDTLATFAESIRGGLVPNRFDDYDDKAAHYNTVDASLWFVRSAIDYYQTTHDAESWNDWLRDAVLSIMDAYIKGTDYDIRMAGDGLITAGGPDTQLTWMDAACGGTVFTPRHGKAVEINALWYHALVALAGILKDTDKRTADHYTKLSKRIKRSFLKVFWNDELKACNDHVWTDDNEEDHVDPTCRPNQVFACAVPNSPLPRTKQTNVLKAVRANLLTPCGLRTLPEHNPEYHGRYTGNQYQRDGAYHRGTVWPWLIGPYAEAVLRVGRFSDKAKKDAADAIQPLLDRLLGEGLGQLNEIHEGDPPHRPVGCIAQAWSIAEVLRVRQMIKT